MVEHNDNVENVLDCVNHAVTSNGGITEENISNGYDRKTVTLTPASAKYLGNAIVIIGVIHKEWLIESIVVNGVELEYYKSTRRAFFTTRRLVGFQFFAMSTNTAVRFDSIIVKLNSNDVVAMTLYDRGIAAYEYVRGY